MPDEITRFPSRPKQKPPHIDNGTELTLLTTVRDIYDTKLTPPSGYYKK